MLGTTELTVMRRWFLACCAGVMLAIPKTAVAQTDNGENAAGRNHVEQSQRTASDETAQSATLYDLVVALAENNHYLIWIIAPTCTVILMLAGFALISAGMCRAKNSANMFAVGLMIIPLAGLAFFVYGFALCWGNWYNAAAQPGWAAVLGPQTVVLNSGIGLGSKSDESLASEFKYGLAGTKGFCLAGMNDDSVLALFFFALAYFLIAATIPTGSLAERWSWKNFCVYGLWVALPFSIFANWNWAGGWLAQVGLNWGWGHGAVDFAGSGVVHGMGGVIALAGSICIGPRIGKYVNAKPCAIPGHNLPMVVLGSLLLLFGWFGMNIAWALPSQGIRIGIVAVNTALAAMAGALCAMLYLISTKKKPDPTMMCNGLIAGLVAISASCAFVDPWAALLIGAIAGVVVILSVYFWEVAGVDDPVGAISMHGASGLWGLLALGLFANGRFGAGFNGVAVRDDFMRKFGADGVRGLFYGDGGQLWAQIFDCLVLCLFGFIVAFICFKLSGFIAPLRVTRDTELRGLDGPEMGALAYPDFVLKGGPTDA